MTGQDRCGEATCPITRDSWCRLHFCNKDYRPSNLNILQFLKQIFRTQFSMAIKLVKKPKALCRTLSVLKRQFRAGNPKGSKNRARETEHAPRSQAPARDPALTFLQELGPQRRALWLPLQLEVFHRRGEGTGEGRQGAFIQVPALQRQHGGRLALSCCPFENQHKVRCVSLTQLMGKTQTAASYLWSRSKCPADRLRCPRCATAAVRATTASLGPQSSNQPASEACPSPGASAQVGEAPSGVRPSARQVPSDSFHLWGLPAPILQTKPGIRGGPELLTFTSFQTFVIFSEQLRFSFFTHC